MSEAENTKAFVPYEQTHRLKPLLWVTTIVPEGQAGFVIQTNNQEECAMCWVCHGKGTISAELASALALPVKKEVVFSIIRAERWPSFKEKIAHRFSVSKASKGIAYCTPLDSVAGISIYKLLSNTGYFEKPMPAENKAKKKERKEK